MLLAWLTILGLFFNVTSVPTSRNRTSILLEREATKQMRKEFLLPSQATLDDLILKVSNLEKFELKKTGKVSKFVILTGAAYNYRESVRNWIAHLHLLGIYNYIVLCFDNRLYQEVGALHGVHVRYTLNLTISQADSGNADFDGGFNMKNKPRTRIRPEYNRTKLVSNYNSSGLASSNRTRLVRKISNRTRVVRNVTRFKYNRTKFARKKSLSGDIEKNILNSKIADSSSSSSVLARFPTVLSDPIRRLTEAVWEQSSNYFNPLRNYFSLRHSEEERLASKIADPRERFEEIMRARRSRGDMTPSPTADMQQAKELIYSTSGSSPRGNSIDSQVLKVVNGSEFALMMVAKHHAIHALLKTNRAVVSSDVDAIWMKPCAIQYMNDNVYIPGKSLTPIGGHVDMIGQQGVAPLVISKRTGACICAGFFMSNPTDVTIQVISDVVDRMVGYIILQSSRRHCDQTILNGELLRRGRHVTPRNSSTLPDWNIVFGGNKSYESIIQYARTPYLSVGFFPYALFPRGNPQHHISESLRGLPLTSEWNLFRNESCIWHMVSGKKGTDKLSAMIKDGVWFNQTAQGD